MSEEPIQTCPSCGKHTKRVISGGTGFIFKGSGFYITDYKRKESKGGESSESSSKRESKSDAKSSDTKSKASSEA